MANKLDSIIKIDNTEYEVVAETAKKTAGTLTVDVKNNGDTVSTTFDGSANKTITIETVDEARHLVNGLAVYEGKDATEPSFTFDGSVAQEIKLLTLNDIAISGTVTKAVGGIAKDKSYSNAAIVDVLSDLLFPYVAPTFTSITLQDVAGTYEYGTTKVVSKVTLNFTKGSKNIISVKIGTTSGGDNLYSGNSVTSGTAITLTTSKTYDGITGGTIYCTISDGDTEVTKSASISYTYYDYSALSTSTTAPTSNAIKQTASGADNSYPYVSGQYLWLYSRSSGKKIQQYISGTWADVNTNGGNSIKLTLESGIAEDYYAYRTDKFTASGSARYRLA